MLPLERVCALIASTRFAFTDESTLQDGLEQMLKLHGVEHVRERELGNLGKVDFYLTSHRVALEAKTQGSPSAVLEQLMRYARHDDVDALVIVTSRTRLGRVPPTLNGKPVYSIPLWANGI